MKTKTHKKFNVSLPIELHTWVLEKQQEEQATTIGDVAISHILTKAVQEMKDKDEGREANEVVQPARRSSASYRQKKTNRQ